ncbi:helix-turn-helix domain-containing protein [Dysosmobacter welbionis]|uniref:helix-turn-helix domain-containing protein n=1 Tax=Dysosmobacter welbionis TaxID=2093857 RepID=UPI002018157B|nr:helix-turn-helix transcriptional regulator [Dysosmobacter welbionis]
MTFSEKLTGLRRKSGMSQEQLADRLGVTRQSVSKWEGGTAMPELVKLISLSELFGVSVDYLVKDWMEEPDNPCGGSGEISSKQADRLEKKVDELTNYVKGRVYRYDSKTRIFGLPLVSIRFGFVRNGKLSMDNTAKGIIAIGNCAIGVVAIGIVGVGLFTFGVLAMGMLSLGIVAGDWRLSAWRPWGIWPWGSAPWGSMPAAWRPLPPRSPWRSPPWRPPPWGSSPPAAMCCCGETA